MTASSSDNAPEAGAPDFEMQIISVLPSAAGPNYGPPMPSDLIGSKIVAIGMPNASNKHEGGGLAIKYIPVGSEQSVCVIFGFNENGMWIDRAGK